MNNRPEVLDSEEEYDLRLRRELGRRLVELRRRRKWSQRELAQRVGVDRSRLGKWERGITVPSLFMLAALSRELEVTPNELLVLKDESEGGMLLTSSQKERLAEAVRTLLGFLQTSMQNTGRKR
ncbi:MAG TPA: helix-turn-helix transcriptional regulator [Thermoanaerobaculia bacterium]|nr:helix-turn-helix transcriptional regulator [Thermoanaerobaculia bacterium]